MSLRPRAACLLLPCFVSKVEPTGRIHFFVWQGAQQRRHHQQRRHPLLQRTTTTTTTTTRATLTRRNSEPGPPRQLTVALPVPDSDRVRSPASGLLDPPDHGLCLSHSFFGLFRSCESGSVCRHHALAPGMCPVFLRRLNFTFGGQWYRSGIHPLPSEGLAGVAGIFRWAKRRRVMTPDGIR